MDPKLILIHLFVFLLTSYGQKCSEEETLLAVKRPIYDFSVRFLDKITQATGKHFVYSPVSTWLELTALLEGARRKTRQELLTVTRLLGNMRQKCYRRKLRDILNGVNEELSLDTTRSSIIIVDKLLKVKDTFIKKAEALDGVKVLSLDFNNYEKLAADVNKIVQLETHGVFDEVIIPEDLNMTTLLLADAAYFKSAWKHSFNPIYTKNLPFYSPGNKTRQAEMMNQNNYFNFTEMPIINAKVLELPCQDERVSMLIFLPIKDSIDDLYYKLKDISLSGIFNQFKIEGVKAINVSLPKFDITTNLDIRELLYDMGLQTIFYPDKSDLKGISDYKINASLMAQLVYIDVSEKYVTAGTAPEFLISGEFMEFNANRPFAFMLVDKKMDLILFAGMYSVPN